MEKIYIAKNLIKHNGRRYVKGEEIRLEEHEVAPLLASKSIEILEIPKETQNFLEGKTDKIPAGTTIITNEEVKNLQTTTEKTTTSDNTHIPAAGDGTSPDQENKTTRESRGRNGDAEAAALQTRLTRTSKTGTTPNANPEKQTNPPAYAEMTNNQQIDYLSSLSDEEFKTRYDELFEASKSKSKTFAEKRMNSINTDNETQE